eukprot:gb/GECH01014562.1/.p1 GENE.gb/GECH01014562.1/~~gb/GECH01014562.1/.p1  ORF type:complete len:323 (+),score=29.84 gb/GECH01014562.1/:1-969(+)
MAQSHVKQRSTNSAYSNQRNECEDDTTLIKTENNWCMLNKEQAPEFTLDNNYILSGYRPELKATNIFKTLFQVHNETGNIWTHLLACLVFGWLTYVCSRTPRLYNGNLSEDSIFAPDRVVFYLFTFSAQVCFASSAVMHLFCCHSEIIHFRLCQLDYCAINGLIMGSTTVAIYYAFYCHSLLRNFYLGFMCLMSVPTFVLPWIRAFHTPQWRSIRAGCFYAFGFSGALALIHVLIKGAIQSDQDMMDVVFKFAPSLLTVGACYTAGAIVFASRVPERWAPGKFDVLFSSHQIFHCLVIGGAVSHYIGMMRAAEWTIESQECI